MTTWVKYPVWRIDPECDTTNELHPKLIALIHHINSNILRGIDLQRWVPIKIIVQNILNALPANKPYIWIRVDKSAKY